MKEQCLICNKLFSKGRLQVHLKKKHKQDPEKYYTNYISSDIPKCPICQENCRLASISKGYLETCGKPSCRAKLVNIKGKENHIRACRERNKKWKTEILPDGRTRQQAIIESGQSKRNFKSIQTGKKISTSLKKVGNDGLTNFKRSFLEKRGVDNPMKLPSSVQKLSTSYNKRTGYD